MNKTKDLTPKSSGNSKLPNAPDTYWLGKLDESGALDKALRDYEREQRWKDLVRRLRAKLHAIMKVQ